MLYSTTPIKSFTGRGSYEILINKKIMQNNTLTAQQLLDLINEKINTGGYKDAVHKIKMMTARDMINEILTN